MADEVKVPVKTNVNDEVVVSDNKGILFLRFFRKDDRNGKILTRLCRKVYFPPYNKKIEPGWYVATVVEERKSFGIMDVMELNDVPKQLWHVNHIKGIYVKRNLDKEVVEIYPVIPKDNLDKEEPVLIYSFPMHKREDQNYSINDVLATKLKEAMGRKTKKYDETTKNKKG